MRKANGTLGTPPIPVAEGDEQPPHNQLNHGLRRFIDNTLDNRRNVRDYFHVVYWSLKNHEFTFEVVSKLAS